MTQNLRVSVEQAAQSALAEYLQNEFDPQFGGGAERCIVNDAWPAPDSSLPRRAVSIIPAGMREDTYLQEEDIRSTPIQGQLRLWTFQAAACRQPLQLDVWSTSAAGRDDLLARLSDSLRKGTQHTLGDPLGPPTWDGVLLALDPNKGGFYGFADFVFDGPRKSDNDRGPRLREYRASMLGFCDVTLTVKAPSLVIARGLLKMTLDNTVTGDVAVT